MNHKTHNLKGFTLLEIIVALGVFAIVALISTSSLLSLTDAQKKAYSIQSAYDNLRFGLETMAKDMRTGENYYCADDENDINPATLTPKNCIIGGPGLTYESAFDRNSNGLNDIIAYRFNSANGSLERFVDGVLFGPVTSEDVGIENLVFYVSGAETTDSSHPTITIIIRGTAGSGRSASQFNLQDTISQRRVGI